VDHIHCLFRLRSEQSLEDVMKEIRGEASKWINSHIERQAVLLGKRIYAHQSAKETWPVQKLFMSQEPSMQTALTGRKLKRTFS